jgi:hypothetical protein
LPGKNLRGLNLRFPGQIVRKKKTAPFSRAACSTEFVALHPAVDLIGQSDKHFLA